MTRYTELLTPGERAEALVIVGEIAATAGYQLARRFIDRAALRPRQCWKTCSINFVRLAMFNSTGCAVTTEAMALALADAGFVARTIGGEPSTNVRLRSLPRRGERIDMTVSMTAQVIHGYIDHLVLDRDSSTTSTAAYPLTLLEQHLRETLRGFAPGEAAARDPQFGALLKQALSIAGSLSSSAARTACR